MRRFIVTLAVMGIPIAAGADAPWEDAIAAALGKSGTEMPGGVYRVGMPRSDLTVVVDGVTLKPSLALGSWAAFLTMAKGQVMVMGDLVLTDSEVKSGDEAADRRWV